MQRERNDDARASLPDSSRVDSLEKAAEYVNSMKQAYDDCEGRRMQAVMNGHDSQEFSCEREFTTFKKAFDVQLAMESKSVDAAQKQLLQQQQLAKQMQQQAQQAIVSPLGGNTGAAAGAPSPP